VKEQGGIHRNTRKRAYVITFACRKRPERRNELDAALAEAKAKNLRTRCESSEQKAEYQKGHHLGMGMEDTGQT